MKRRRRADLQTGVLYAARMLRMFRGTLALLVALILAGGFIFSLSPSHPSALTSLFSAWMALFAQTITPPDTWYLQLVCGVYPLFGVVVIGEGIVRLGMLMISRQHGEKEWMAVMASTYRDHVVLCGLGHLGYRILGQLLAAGTQVVALEKEGTARFLPDARRTGVPILIRDMKDDQALLDAGVEHARAIVIATNDDMANLEVALDARRMNPKIRILMRLFDQQIADKLKEARLIDEAFSSAALAAPVVAEMTLAVLKS
jgi:hypothetical protein